MKNSLGVMALLAAGILAAYIPSVAAAATAGKIRVYSAEKKGYIMSVKVVKTEAEWRKLLTKEQYHVLRENGTERAYSNEYWDNHAEGVYRCGACGLDLFSSKTKYDSRTGWPSFWEPIAKENITTKDDYSFFSHRIDVRCARCGSHIGHVFNDGPKPTGLRYCMNSAALKFIKMDV